MNWISVKKKLRRLLDGYIPIATPKKLTEEEKKKRHEEIINEINRRIAMRDDC